MKQNVIAIDGPAGAGKSTVAKQVAATLNFTYIDTGAMYRAVTCRVLALRIAETDVQAIADLARTICVRLGREDGKLRVEADGIDVTEEIRTPTVTAMVPVISQVPAVRQAMVRLQQEMAKAGSVVIDGRDIGTVVVPDACTKIFLTASAEERARRRWQELKAAGHTPDLIKLQVELVERDRKDSERELSPLLQAADAFFLDTTGCTITDVVQEICNVYQSRCKHV
jgi:cytidylate kinase